MSVGGRPRGFAPESLRLIDATREILAEQHPAGVRAVCYRLFVRGLIASMAKGNTNAISRLLTGAREQGLIDPDWMIDESRTEEIVTQFADLADYADGVQQSYRRNRWAEQPRTVIVVSEKATVGPTLRPITEKYGVVYLPVHGFNSFDKMWRLARRSDGLDQPIVVLYCGDYDPSGMCMSELDLPGRLERYGGRVDVIRVALTREQIEDAEPGLPSFPAADKGPSTASRGDTRYPWFVRTFGDRCWELDALPPVALREAVEGHIRGYIEWTAWRRAEAVEAAEMVTVAEIAAQLRVRAR